MGAELLEDAELRRLCGEASEAAGVDLAHLLAGADEDELRLTSNAQPALCFMGVALARLLSRRGIVPAAVAGHSVGEYAALCVAGAVSLREAIGLVAERGRAMAAAIPAGDSSMAAVLGLAPSAVEAAVAGLGQVWPANYNTPSQTVIGGEVDALARAELALKAAGARRVVPLAVSAAFHTPLMAPAAGRLRSALDRASWSPAGIPVIANLDARTYAGGAPPPERLERQLSSPVRWAACVEALAALGCDAFIELGPKRALTGMMRELVPGAFAVAVAGPGACADLALPGW